MRGEFWILYILYIVEGTFTGFHRVFAADELVDKQDACGSDKDPQAFKDAYEGRTVVSTGKWNSNGDVENGIVMVMLKME